MHEGSGQKGHTFLSSRYVYCGPIRCDMTFMECNYVQSVCTCVRALGLMHTIQKWWLVSILYIPELSIIAFQPDALVQYFDQTLSG